jgi:hypothetical protein
MMASVASGRRFPLLDRLQVAIPLETLSEAVSFSGSATGIDTDKLAYFALSMIWRGAVHEWPLLLGGKSIKLDLGGHEEPIRRYLLGLTPFPDAAVVVHVCNDMLSRQLMFEPFRCAENGPSFEMLTLGVHFVVFLGSTITEQNRNLCCVKSKTKILFVRDCRQRLAQHFSPILKTSKRSKDIQSEWPD